MVEYRSEDGSNEWLGVQPLVGATGKDEKSVQFSYGSVSIYEGSLLCDRKGCAARHYLFGTTCPGST